MWCARPATVRQGTDRPGGRLVFGWSGRWRRFRPLRAGHDAAVRAAR